MCTIDYYLTNGHYDARKSEQRKKELQRKRKMRRFTGAISMEIMLLAIYAQILNDIKIH